MESTKQDRAIKLRREYYREWRKRNKDRVRTYNKRYWEHRVERENSTLNKNDHNYSI